MSTIKLYSSANTSAGAWKLIPSKLFKIDSIADYLATFTPTTISNAQYIKQGLEINIKLNMTQDKSQPNSTSGYKYVSIQNSATERIAYYYVRKAVWRSQNTIQFDLVMDVLNTYNDGSDYVFKNNTRILREHKPRFTRNPLHVNVAIGNTISTHGLISVGDTIKVYRDESGDFILICTGEVIERYAESISILVSSDDSYSRIEEQFERGIHYNDIFQFSKNNSNYFECYLDQGVYTFDYSRKIDFIQENINPLLIRNNDENAIEETGVLKQNWYLLYRNQNDPSESLVNPVQCFLIGDNSTPTNAGYITSGRLVPSYLESGKYYYFDNSNSATFTLSNGVTIGGNCIMVTKSGNKIVIQAIQINGNGNYDPSVIYSNIEYVDISIVPIGYGISSSYLNTHPNDSTLYTFFVSHTNDYTFDDSEDYNYISGIKELDKTDAKNIKLIKLPYCPYDFQVSGGILQVADDDNWEYAEFEQYNHVPLRALKLKDLSTKLENTLDASASSPFSNLVVNLSPSINNLRQGVFTESKLFNSEFYAPTYVYDSFSLHIDLERCKLDYYVDNADANDIKFTMTSTINSKFLFTFASYKADKNVENFYNIIPVARNNEMVLYNVPYINYIRNGFNYDVKNKNLSNASNFLGLGLSAAGVAASLALPSVPLKAIGVVASIIGLASSVKTTIVETLRNEEALKQKLIQAQNQTSSVAGSDDVDLMSEYCGNRLRYYIYQPTDTMKNLIYDLFFYAGYNSGRMGIPNHNTRVNFDYLECDASLESAGANIPEEILEEIKNAYKVGVTFIHKTSRTTNKWDIEQKYENWEAELLED